MKTKSETANTPNGWQKFTLGELLEFKNGVNAEKASYGSGVPFVNVMEIIRHDVLDVEKIPGRINVDKKTLEKNLVVRGDVLFNRTSETPEEIGLTSVYLDNKTAVFGGFVIRGRSRNQLISEGFKKYCFSSKKVRHQIIERGQGVLRMNIGQKDLEKVVLSFPGITQQDKIVEVLDTWDKAIDKLTKKIELKKFIKTSLVQRLISGRARLPNFHEPWKTVPAGDLFRNVTKKNHPDEPLLSATQDQGVIPRDMLVGRVMSPEGSRSSYKLVEPGNFVISLRSFQGGLELSRYRGIVSPAYTVLTEKLPIKREFYRLYFKTHQAISSLDSSVIGIRDGKQISYESFKHIEIPYPSVNEQEAIAQTVSIFERELLLLEKKLATTRNIKSYLLNNLVTGNIRTPEDTMTYKV